MTLRAAVNLANPVLVTSRDGSVDGLAPAIAALVARRLERTLHLVEYPNAAAVAASAARREWDIALVASDPARVGAIDFSRPYALIEARYAVAGDSPVRTADDVDREGQIVLAHEGSAYALWLHTHLTAAHLVDVADDDAVVAAFLAHPESVIAALGPTAVALTRRIPGLRSLGDPFMTVAQCVGVPRGSALAASVDAAIGAALESGAVQRLVDRYDVGAALSVPAVRDS